METMTYKKFIDSVPEETTVYINRLLMYLFYFYNNDTMKMDVYDAQGNFFMELFNESNIIKCLSVVAYGDLNEENKNRLKILGFDKGIDIKYTNISNDTYSHIFDRYCYFFSFDDKSEDDYRLLTPEEIIEYIYNNYGVSYSDVFSLFNDFDKFKDYIHESMINKKGKIRMELTNKVNKKLDGELIRYFINVGSVYGFLTDHKNNIKRLPTSKDDIIVLSLLIALLNNSYYDNYQDETKAIIDYCSKLGLNLKKLEEITNYTYSITDVRYVDNSTMYVANNFEKIINKNSNLTITQIFYNLLNNAYNDSSAIKMILSECRLNKEDFNGLADVLADVKDNKEIEASEKIIVGLLPDAYNCMENIARWYTYLYYEYQQGKIDKCVVDDEKDLIALSVLIESYNYDTDLVEFLKENGINLESIAKVINNPLNNTISEYPNISLYRFKKYITSGNCYLKQKEDITSLDILNNVYDNNVEKSDIIKRIYNIITNKNLGNISEKIESFYKDKEQKRKKTLEESLLKGISKDVYECLQLITCDYQQLEMYKDHIEPDILESIAIISAIQKKDSLIHDYLNEKGLSIDNIAHAIKISDSKLKKNRFDAIDYTFDIDIINNVFKKYIFDRENKNISIYSILENVFKLNNSFEFDKFLYQLNVNKSDFENINIKLDEFHKEQNIINEKREIDELFKNCKKIETLMEDTLRINTYIKDNYNKETSKINKDIIKTEKDIEALSLLTSIMLHDNDDKKALSVGESLCDNEIYCNKYLIHNGITLELILKILGITNKELNTIISSEYDKELILNYKKYISNSIMDYYLMVRKLFDNRYNKLLKKLTEMTGNKYEYLEEEIKNQKMRQLTPEEGIALLTEEVAPILSGESIIDVASYGDELSKHTFVINDALHNLVFTNNLEHSVDDINKLCDKVSMDYKEEHQGILSFFTNKKKEEIKPVDKSNIVNEIKTSIADNSKVLIDELKGFEYIKKYIEAYLIKLNEYLSKLQDYKIIIGNKIDELNNIDPSNDMKSYTELLNYMSLKDITDNKINTFNTAITLMSQELVKVHRAIVTHFITINALNTSNNAILPLIASEIALNIGTKSEGKALSVSKELFDLLQNVVNQNVVGTKDNLEKLSNINSLDPIALDSMNKNVISYLEMVKNSNELLDTEEAINKKVLKKENN